MPAPEQANRPFGDLSVVGDSRQESVKRNISTTEPSDSLHPRDHENDTEPSQITGSVENSCSRANDAPEREDSGTAKDTSAPSGLSAPLSVRSTLECFRVL